MVDGCGRFLANVVDDFPEVFVEFETWHLVVEVVEGAAGGFVVLTEGLAVVDLRAEDVTGTFEEDARPDVVEAAHVPLVFVHRELVERRNHFAPEGEVHRTDGEVVALGGNEIAVEVVLRSSGLGLSLQVAVHQNPDGIEVGHVRPEAL